MTGQTITLITGGSRSGKSRFALQRSEAFGRKIFLATAVATDPEMAGRIARHQRERDPGFKTVEEPLHLARAIRSHASSADVILVDCLTFWLNNLLYSLGGNEEAIQKEIKDLLALLEEKPTSLILVTNETNMGVIAGDSLSRRFVDEQGRLNQEAARRSDEVVFMLSGIPQVLKKMENQGERPPTAEGAPALAGGTGAVPARGSMPRAGGGEAKLSRPLTLSSVIASPPEADDTSSSAAHVFECGRAAEPRAISEKRDCSPLRSRSFATAEPGFVAPPPDGAPRNDALESWANRVRAIPPLDPVWREKARQRLKEQTRPEGSLGELERALERLAAIQEKERPSVSKKRIYIFAGDHGVEKEGVSLYPREVTPAMVSNFLSGGATINAFARSVGAEVKVVDVGVDYDFEGAETLPASPAGGPGRQAGAPLLIHRKIRRGTSNIKETQAMSAKELNTALQVGWDRALEAKREGVELLGVGEMGIGNTTAASACIAALTKSRPDQMTGHGTGIDEKMLAHKIQIIEESLCINAPFLRDPFSILQSVGGFEIAGVAGCIMGAAAHRIPCVIDGWIATAGALAPIQINPAILDYLFFAHESEERGHKLLLEELEARPLLRLSMRLGEGTGACLAMGILDAAVRAYNEVATFEEAKVAGSKRKEDQGDSPLSARTKVTGG